jgi:4a-hydroxytetrahydrobiopterin dehydratase
LRERYRQLNGGWKLVAEESLEKEFKFPDFRTVLEFTNLVGNAAESLNHHPDIYLTFGKVRLEISTHQTGGLADHDFGLAAKVTELQSASPGA